MSGLSSAGRRLRGFRRLGWGERVLFLESWMLLGWARALVLAVPLRWLVPRPLPVANAVAGEDTDVGDERREEVRRLGRMLRKASRHTPWESNCLAQALAGRWMLERRELPTTLYLGVAKDPRDLTAHAWLRCRGQTVVGGPESGVFTPIAAFAPNEPPARAGSDSH